MIRGQAGLRARLALFYAAAFGTIGIHLPYFPVWLEAERGLDAGTIGLLIAALYWPRVLTSLWVGRLADRLGERRRPMILLAALTLGATLLYSIATGFWPLLILSLVTGGTFAAILPLGEAVALPATRRAGLDYGRVRLFGSLAFILTASGTGYLVEQTTPAAILPVLCLLLLATLGACMALPREVGSEPDSPAVGTATGTGRSLVVMLSAAALIQASHAAYYGFASIHWRSAGLGETAIGWLWAEGVLAEVVLFALAGRLFQRAKPWTVLLLAGALTILRWSAFAFTTDVVVLAFVQSLHAASFGLTHLATMHHLREAVRSERLAGVQGAFASGTALLFGMISPFTGWLFERNGAIAFAAMAGIALVAVALLVLAPRARPGAA